MLFTLLNLKLRFFILIPPAYSADSYWFAVYINQLKVRTRKGMTPFTVLFSSIYSCWRVTSKNIFRWAQLLKMFWVYTKSVPTDVVYLHAVFDIFFKKFIRKSVGHGGAFVVLPRHHYSVVHSLPFMSFVFSPLPYPTSTFSFYSNVFEKEFRVMREKVSFHITLNHSGATP